MRLSIPKGWRKKKLADIADVQTGVAKGKKNIPDPVARPYLRVANVQDGHLDLSEIKTIEVSRHQIDRFSLREGDVLFTEGGDFDKLGRGTVWQGEVPNCLHQNHVFAVRMKNGEMLPYFLATYAASFWGRTYFLSCSKQTTNLASINSSQLKEMPLPLPPLPEQQKIAAILSTWDRAIELTEKLIAAKQKRKQALMQQLLTGKVRFAEFNSNEWTTCKLGEVASIRRGASPRPIGDAKYFAETGRGWVRIADVTASPDRFLRRTKQYLSPLGESCSVPVNPGDLIMSICATIGVPKILEMQACIHDGFVLIKAYDRTHDTNFIYHFIDFRTKQLTSQGQPGTQQNLNTSIVNAIKVPTIKRQEQRCIAAVLNDTDRELVSLRSKAGRIREQKKGLMQQLLTGKVRVNVDAELVKG